MLNWLKKQLLEKWIGRLIVIACAALSGWLAHFVPADVAANFAEAFKALAEAALPLLIAWLLGVIRHQKALATEPPAK